MAEKRGFTWTVHRPHTMIGFVIGNAMNMAVTLAVYASICKHTGRPFVYPGSPEQYNAVTDVTDARILAEQLHWAATTPEAANTPFNIVNGDVFRWTWLWRQIAEYFGLEVGAYPGHPTPLEEQMADAPAIWAEIVAKHGLQDIPVGKLASWWHSDADLGRTLECFTDMTNSRLARLRRLSADDPQFLRRLRRVARREQAIIPLDLTAASRSGSPTRCTRPRRYAHLGRSDTEPDRRLASACRENDAVANMTRPVGSRWSAWAGGARRCSACCRPRRRTSASSAR